MDESDAIDDCRATPATVRSRRDEERGAPTDALAVQDDARGSDRVRDQVVVRRERVGPELVLGRRPLVPAVPGVVGQEDAAPRLGGQATAPGPHGGRCCPRCHAGRGSRGRRGRGRAGSRRRPRARGRRAGAPGPGAPSPRRTTRGRSPGGGGGRGRTESGCGRARTPGAGSARGRGGGAASGPPGRGAEGASWGSDDAHRWSLPAPSQKTARFETLPPAQDGSPHSTHAAQ